MHNLKNKTISGLFWSFIENLLSQGLQFIVGIILARILMPSDFGKIGIITSIIFFLQSFVDGGFGSALIRKKNTNNLDYSTIFFFNICISIILFLFIFSIAKQIANYFNDIELTLLIKYSAFGLIINSFGFIQRIIYTKQLNFKIQTKISILSSILSGIISITLAILGFGVLSLVVLNLTKYIFNTILLWYFSKWKPLIVFSSKAFIELFNFGGKLFISSIIDSLYRNMFLLFIGKFFSLSQLGFYTRADQFRSIPSENLNNMISRVSYPILSEIQDDKVLLKKAYIKLIRNTMFLSFNLMIILAAIADPLIKVLLGIKWQSTSNYLELLCFVGMLYPLHSLNLNMLQVQGKGGLFLKLEVIKKLFTIPIIITAYYFGISAMIIAMFIHSSLSYLLNSYWSGNHIEYSAKSQIKDIIPSFLFAIIIGLPIYLIGQYPVFSSFYTLSLQLIIAIILFFSMGELTSNNEYLYIKTTLLSKFLDK